MTEDEFCRAIQGPYELTPTVNSTSSVQETNATSSRPPDVAEEEPVLSWDSWRSHICHAALGFCLFLQIVLEINCLCKVGLMKSFLFLGEDDICYFL